MRYFQIPRRRYQHLVQLCTDFSEWYNDWWLYKFLGSGTPTVAFQNKPFPLVPKIAKDVPTDLEINPF
jgi:hypothetical protein